MRAVYDTNVLISGLFWDGPPREIILRATRRELELIISPPLLEELSRILHRSLASTESEVAAIINLILDISTMAYPSERLDIVRDKKDNMVLECAVEGKCEYLVTGDADLLELKEFRGIKIVKPRAFLEVLEG
jgi:putative PIN family toxin of toxin-antitoxin system